MSYIYEQRKRPFAKDKAPRADTAVHGPEAAPPMPGTAGPAGAQTVLDLDAAMKAKIQHTFGDLSAVKNYTPPAREQAPSQSAPYTGSVTHTLSDASPSPAAAGPMQAKKRDKDARAVKEMQQKGDSQNWNYALKGSEGYDDLNPEEWEEKTHTPGFSKLWGKKDQTFKVRKMTPEQKKASQDADNLFAIYRGQQYYDENDDSELTTENENGWFDTMTRNPSVALLWEMQRRYETLTKKAIAKRDKMVSDQTGAGGQADINMANFEAGLSDENYDAQGYLDILTSMLHSATSERNPAVKQFVEERDVNGTSARDQLLDDAKPIIDATANNLDRELNLSPDELEKLKKREEEAGTAQNLRSKKLFEKQRR